MSKILEKLNGDDLRSIGKTDEVVQDIQELSHRRMGLHVA